MQLVNAILSFALLTLAERFGCARSSSDDTSQGSLKPTPCGAPSECIKISDCRFFRSSSDHQVTLDICGPGEKFDRQVCCLNYTLYLKSKTPVYASCQSPSVCIPIIRCLAHRRSPHWQTTGETCGPGVFARRQICCLGPTLPPTLARPSKDLNCGKSLVSNPLMPIDDIGTSQDGAWPWVVRIDCLKDGELYWIDVGLLIDQQHVLVTADTLFNLYRFSKISYRVIVPNKLLQEDEVYEVKEYVLHPLYDDIEVSGSLAILKLHEKIRNPDVHPICLPNEELLNTNIVGLDATMVGYDMHENLMQYSHMRILSTSQCYDAYNGSRIFPAPDIEEDDICAELREEYANNDKMESGGFFMISHGEQWFAVGVFPLRYMYFDYPKPIRVMRISSYLDWIKSVLEN